MAMGSFNTSGAQAPMAEINTTPLVDVMLVLLIIFIITAPLLTHSVNVDLPRASAWNKIAQRVLAGNGQLIAPLVSAAPDGGGAGDDAQATPLQRAGCDMLTHAPQIAA